MKIAEMIMALAMLASIFFVFMLIFGAVGLWIPLIPSQDEPIACAHSFKLGHYAMFKPTDEFVRIAALSNCDYEVIFSNGDRVEGINEEDLKNEQD